MRSREGAQEAGLLSSPVREKPLLHINICLGIYLKG